MHREVFMATNGYVETREQKLRSNKWRENIQYMDINLNTFLNKLKDPEIRRAMLESFRSTKH